MKDHATFNSMVLCYRYKIPKGLVNLYRGGVLDMSKNEPGNRGKNGAVTIVSFSVFFMLFTKAPASMQFMGNNAYAAGYVKGYVGSGCGSREECIREALEKRMEEQAGEKDFEEIFRIERGNMTWVFFGGTNDILKFECVLEDNGQYYISGSSALVYHGFFEEPAYSDIETVRSDVANCIRNERWRSDDTPVWGVTKNPKGPELSINGIRADFTLEVKDEEGQSYYFWVIEDIGAVKDAEDIEKLSIEGLL